MKRHIASHVARYCVVIAAIASCASAHGESSAHLKLIPEKTTLSGMHARQQLLVEGVTKDQFTGDKTSAAKFASSDPAIATVDESGVVHAAKDGDVTITATVDGQSSTAAVSVTGMQHEAPRSFRNDVQPVLAKITIQRPISRQSRAVPAAGESSRPIPAAAFCCSSRR
jgi:hypothetical protein